MTPEAAVARLFAETEAPFGIAVSGGGDSLALLLLCADAVAAGAPPPHPSATTGEGGASPRRALFAATVDHGLRPEAAGEADFVAQVCGRLHVPHDVLRWEHGALSGNLMQEARRARYRLLAAWAGGVGLAQVVLGHSADDQAEGFLIGLARSAGLDGLSGMRGRFEVGGVTFHRPLLGVSRKALRQVLVARGQAWVEDPTNADDRYTRTRVRKVLKALAPLGIGAGVLAGVVENLASSRAAMQAVVVRAAEMLAVEAAGTLRIDRAGFADLPQDVARRLLVSALMWIARAEHPPRAEAVARVLAAVRDGRAATLHGCRIRPRSGSVLIAREPRAVRAGDPFDGRWHLTGPMAPGQAVRALGPEGLRLCPDWRATGLPRDALVVSPSVWEGERLVAAPLARPDPAWSAEVRPEFAAWIAH